MNRWIVAAHTAVTTRVREHREQLRDDDSGAVTTETAIITAIIGAAALALTGVIVAVVSGFEADIAGLGGSD